jgi:hypothetical protein
MGSYGKEEHEPGAVIMENINEAQEIQFRRLELVEKVHAHGHNILNVLWDFNEKSCWIGSTEGKARQKS